MSLILYCFTERLCSFFYVGAIEDNSLYTDSDFDSVNSATTQNLDTNVSFADTEQPVHNTVHKTKNTLSVADHAFKERSSLTTTFPLQIVFEVPRSERTLNNPRKISR